MPLISLWHSWSTSPLPHSTAAWQTPLVQKVLSCSAQPSTSIDQVENPQGYVTLRHHTAFAFVPTWPLICAISIGPSENSPRSARRVRSRR